jgi:L-amino acid N-acyltransferase YncA
MNQEFKIRPITLNDAKATLEIYRPFVEKTIISFEYEAPSLAEWEERIKTNTNDYPWLVCAYKNEVIGYAYGSRHRYRTAYSWSPESTVYVSEKFHRLGIAKILYTTLFGLLKVQGYVNVYAGVGMPNVKSEEFHQALGFTELGTFKKIGYKFGAWHDTRWFQLHLTAHPDNPSLPKKTAQVENSEAFIKIIDEANQNAAKIPMQ